MDLGGLSELSWTEKDKYQLYVESKKYKKLVTVTIKKKKQTHRYRGQTVVTTVGNRGTTGVGKG